MTTMTSNATVLRKRWKSGSKKPFPRPMQLLSLRVPIITRRVVAIWSIFEFGLAALGEWNAEADIGIDRC
jgi:hypothetical protein